MARDEKRILVVDDDEAIRALLFTILRRRGFKVDTAKNGVEACDLSSRCHYAVILLDLMMPLMSGQEVLSRFAGIPRSQRPIIIVLTAGAPALNLPDDLVSGTIRKPFDIQLLVDTVIACLATVAKRTQLTACPDPESDAPAAREDTN